MIDTLILTFFFGGGGRYRNTHVVVGPRFPFQHSPDPLFECLHGTKGIELYTVRTGVNENEEEEAEKTRERFAAFQGHVQNDSAHMCEKGKS